MTGFEPGLLDKLLDDDARRPASPVLRHHSMDEIKAVVARDLEALLNTRMVYSEEVLADFPQCRQSVATYGLTDFSGLSLASYDDRMHICRSIENAIERHEPRLKQVVVALEVERQSSTHVLYFGITAVLAIGDLREPVNFDALLQPTTLQYAVSRGQPKPRH